MSVVDEIDAERRARRQAGDPRLTEAGRRVLRELASTDALAAELRSISGADELLGGDASDTSS